jgi:hypothetical protein
LDSDSSQHYIKILTSIGCDVYAPDHNRTCDLQLGRCTRDLRYNSNSEKYLQNIKKFRNVYKRVLDLRTDELNTLLSYFKKVILIGVSEGAMVVSQCKSTKVVKKIILSYPCEKTYFTFRKSVFNCPTINIIGTKDEYFSCKNSISSRVAHALNYSIQGHAPKSNAKVVIIKNASHDLVKTGNLREKIKSYISTFIYAI